MGRLMAHRWELRKTDRFAIDDENYVQVCPQSYLYDRLQLEIDDGRDNKLLRGITKRWAHVQAVVLVQLSRDLHGSESHRGPILGSVIRRLDLWTIACISACYPGRHQNQVPIEPASM